MNLETAITMITFRKSDIENKIATFVNKNATLYYDSITQHAEFYLEELDDKAYYDDLIEKRNRMRTAIEVLEEVYGQLK